MKKYSTDKISWLRILIKSKKIIPEFTILKYIKPDNYIKRSLRDYIKADSLDVLIRTQLDQQKYLVDYLTQEIPEKRIVLYSEAQEGKSTELKNIAYEAQSSELFNVIFYELKYYTGNSFSDDIGLDYLRSDNTKRNLLILDGLDEVKDERRQDVIRKIEQIVLENPDLFIIISCRGNFEQTNHIEGFRKLYLNPINYNDVKQYIQKKCTHPLSLIEEIENKNLYELIHNPFYLNTIIQYYQEKGSLPETKTEIYDYVIEKSFDKDQEKNPGGVITIRETAMPILSKIAFCLQFTEEAYFNYNQLTQELSLSQNDIVACCKNSIFKKDSENNYNFTHNAFREYLTAKHLINISFENLVSAICYPQTNILRPYLYNTITLLVSILEKDSPLFSDLIEWLADNSPETLFMCEKHFLSNERCVEIVKAYFEQLKKYDEYINFQKAERIMSFANFRETILYLFEEAKKEETLSCNLSNILSLLEFANINLLSSNESDEIYKYGLKLIGLYKNDVDKVHMTFDLFKNKSYKTPKRIAELHSIIKECNNPRLLNFFFKVIKDEELSDYYINWVISKKDVINDYNTPSGYRVLVEKGNLIDALTSVKENENIITVLKILQSETIFYLERDKYPESMSRLFDSLKRSSEAISTVQLNNLLDILHSQHLRHSYFGEKASIIVNEFRDFLFKKELDERIFLQYHKALKIEIINPSQSDSDRYEFIDKCLNVISTIMTDQRFNSIIHDNQLSEEQIFFIANRLGGYEIISTKNEWNDKIEALNNKYLPAPIDYTKRTQDGFDILFDYERFKEEIRVVEKKYPRLSLYWEKRVKLLIEDAINESVLTFIWDFVTKDKRDAEIDMDIVIKKAEDVICFNEFIFIQLTKYIDHKIYISDNQQKQINQLITNWVDNIQTCPDTNNLGQLILVHKVKLNDIQLLSLLPYSYHKNKRKNINSLDENSIDESLLKYIEDNISNIKLLISEIDSLIDKEDQFWPPLFYIFTEYIVIRRIDSLYKHFEKILFIDLNHWGKGHYENYKLQILARIINLGQIGLELIKVYLNYLDEETRIHFYKMIIQHEKLQLNENEIIHDLHDIYKSKPEKYKEIILSLLLSLGDIDGLKMFLDYYKSNPNSFEYIQPTFIKFGYDQIEIMMQIFRISCTLDLRERSHIQEAAFSWLNNIALESEESRDYIGVHYECLSEEDPESYSSLLRFSKYIYNKYFEKNSPAMSITEAANLFAIVS